VKSRVFVVVPTLDAAGNGKGPAGPLENVSPHQVLILDSSSNNGTSELARSVDFTVREIERTQFNLAELARLEFGLLRDGTSWFSYAGCRIG
jgi:hypothetical protein